MHFGSFIPLADVYQISAYICKPSNGHYFQVLYDRFISTLDHWVCIPLPQFYETAIVSSIFIILT